MYLIQFMCGQRIRLSVLAINLLLRKLLLQLLYCTFKFKGMIYFLLYNLISNNAHCLIAQCTVLQWCKYGSVNVFLLYRYTLYQNCLQHVLRKSKYDNVLRDTNVNINMFISYRFTVM